MSDVSFNGIAIVAAVALGAPLALGLFPKLRLPAIVLEIVLGIAIGPQVLGWVSIDTPIPVLSLLGLAFLRFLAGLEVEYDRFRGRSLRLTALADAISFGLFVVAVGMAVLGAFVAGAIIKLFDRDQTMTRPQFRAKLEAVGYGVFVPFFFVSTGVRFDLDALFASGDAIARVPIFLGALLVAAGLLSVLLFPRTALRLLRGAAKWNPSMGALTY